MICAKHFFLSCAVCSSSDTLFCGELLLFLQPHYQRKASFFPAQITQDLFCHGVAAVPGQFHSRSAARDPRPSRCPLRGGRWLRRRPSLCQPGQAGSLEDCHI